LSEVNQKACLGELSQKAEITSPRRPQKSQKGQKGREAVAVLAGNYNL